MLQNVLIYNGPGTCRVCVQQTWRTFNQLLSHAYDVKTVDLPTLANVNIPWDRNLAMFVMPGGRDYHYDRDFRQNYIVDRLLSAVKTFNTKYFGICAGAYFAADRIVFEEGRPGYEVCGDRLLKLVKETAKGPLIPGIFKYSEDQTEAETSFESVELELADSSTFKSLYIGGCYFEGGQNCFAKYQFNGKTAIIATETAILSGVHLEYDPIDILPNVKEVEKPIITELIAFEPQRRRVLADLLSRLGLSVSEKHDMSVETMQVFTNGFTSQTQGFCFSDICSQKTFNYDLFIENLTSDISHLHFMYSPVVTSTQTTLMDQTEWIESMPHFSVFLADHQVKGRGRGANSWISSPACLQFTLLLKHPSAQSAQLPMIQYLMAIAAVATINSYQFKDSQIKARIKWPNDIFLSNSSTGIIGKIGGILTQATASLRDRRIQHVFVGTGLNLLTDPNLPTVTHLNDYLAKPTTKEVFLAELLSRFNALYSQFVKNKQFPFNLYYQHWLHNQQTVQFEDKTVRIVGIDESGYLLVRDLSKPSQLYTLEPDGNSFDMMNNLLRRK